MADNYLNTKRKARGSPLDYDICSTASPQSELNALADQSRRALVGYFVVPDIPTELTKSLGGASQQKASQEQDI
jgi:hypothetical protein